MSEHAPSQSADTAWHRYSIEFVLSKLGATVTGLSAREVAIRREQYGQNVLPATKGKTALQRLLAQFNNLLIYVLLASGLWNYAQPIWRLLSLRGDVRAGASMFGAAYPENPEKIAREAAEREETEREERRPRLAAELRIIGVTAILDTAVLNKLERIMMESAEEGEK